MTISSPTLKPFPGGALTGNAVYLASRVRIAEWDRHARNPRGVQLRTLREHLARSAATEFGRAHNFDRIRTYEDFKREVPLRTYADFEPFLQRMRKGERDVLYPGLIPFYGQSSGTSNTAALNKFLPVSTEQIHHQQRAGFDHLARFIRLSGNREVTAGWSLFLFPPATVRMEGDVGYASNPALMLHHLPWATTLLALPKPPIRDLENYDDKLTAIAEAYLDYDVRVISGTTCWFSIMFDRLLEVARRRGRRVSTVAEIWPNLCVLFGGGVYAEPYRAVIEARIGRPTPLMDNYNATEGGIFAGTDHFGDEAMLVMPHRGVFFEFVPREEHGQANPTRLPLWEVEPGVDYSVVVTTAAGLYGYYMGDFVRFRGVSPHRLEFAGRASGVLSVTQELTTFIELEKAVARATVEQPSVVSEFAASSEVGIDGTAKGRYVVFVEFARDPEDLAAFTQAFDRELCRQNRVYREHRAKEVAILPPVVVPLQAGSTKKFMEAIGRNNMQQKFPRIVDERRRDLLRTLARN